MECDLAATYVISSGGDAPPEGTIDRSIAIGDETQDRSLSMDKISHDDTSTFDGNSVTESMLEFGNPDCVKASENDSIRSKLEDNFDSSKLSQPTPVGSLFVIGRDEPRDGAASRPTANKNFRNSSKRKISVFHRSFDVDTLHCDDAGGGQETYRVTERSMSTPSSDSIRDKRVDESMELDQDCMTRTSNTRNFMLDTYRTNDGDSDSSSSLSPRKSLGIQEDGNMSPPGLPSRSVARSIIIAPTKLKLPLLNEIPAYADGIEKKNSKVSGNDETNDNVDETKDDVKFDRDASADETRGTYDLSNDLEGCEGDSASTEAGEMGEMIRPGDEIERGITYRRTSFSRESDFSAYSLLSPAEESGVEEKRDDSRIESASTVVLSDGESTSCDSSPRRDAQVVKSTLKLPLVSTYEKPVDRAYARYGECPREVKNTKHERSRASVDCKWSRFFFC